MKIMQRAITFYSPLPLFASLCMLIATQGAIAGDSLKVSTNSIGMKFVHVPPGEFMMGTTSTEAERLAELSNKLNWKPFWPNRLRSETPQRKVKISNGFELGIHEVTVAQFREFVNATKYKTQAELEEKSHGTWRHPMKNVEPVDSHPIEQVTWNDAENFCRWLSKKEGRQYRLPTEQEWEYACRAGSATRWSHGDDVSKLADYAWYNSNHSRGKDGGYRMHPVGKKKPNLFGLYDMHGNAWEWCAPASSQDRQDERPGVIRGGPVHHPAERVRSAVRARVPLSYHHPKCGFRVMRIHD